MMLPYALLKKPPKAQQEVWMKMPESEINEYILTQIQVVSVLIDYYRNNDMEASQWMEALVQEREDLLDAYTLEDSTIH